MSGAIASAVKGAVKDAVKEMFGGNKHRPTISPPPRLIPGRWQTNTSPDQGGDVRPQAQPGTGLTMRQPSLPLPPQEPRQFSQADPYVLMENIDRLQKKVHELRKTPAAGNPASDERRQMSNSVNLLLKDYETYLAQMRGERVGVPVDHRHLDFLQSYALNALQDAQSATLRIELNAPSEEASLIALPLHVELLNADDRKSFVEDLALINSLLQGKTSPMAPSDVEELLEVAFRLGKLNSSCVDALRTRMTPLTLKNYPALIRSRQKGIDAFRTTLEHAVSAAIGSEPPEPAMTQRALANNNYDARPPVVTLARGLAALDQPSSVSSEPSEHLKNWLSTADFGYGQYEEPLQNPYPTAGGTTYQSPFQSPPAPRGANNDYPAPDAVSNPDTDLYSPL